MGAVSAAGHDRSEVLGPEPPQAWHGGKDRGPRQPEALAKSTQACGTVSVPVLAAAQLEHSCTPLAEVESEHLGGAQPTLERVKYPSYVSAPVHLKAKAKGVEVDQSALATVQIDSACTIGMIGAGEIQYAHNIRKADPVRIQTGKGTIESSSVGDLQTVDAEGNTSTFVGYLAPECPYSLWPLADRIGEDGTYIQTQHSARIEYPDGRVAHFSRSNGLWFEDVVTDTTQVETAAVSELEEIYPAYFSGTAAVSVQHSIQGHPHDPKCEHCLRGRQRLRGRPHKSVRHIDSRGVTVHMDLMGPFEPDLDNTVYEVTVLEGTYGWLEIGGIKDKSSAATAAKLKDQIRDTLDNSNQDPREVGRAHTDHAGC